jgi:hypothetical protein
MISFAGPVCLDFERDDINLRALSSIETTSLRYFVSRYLGGLPAFASNKLHLNTVARVFHRHPDRASIERRILRPTFSSQEQASTLQPRHNQNGRRHNVHRLRPLSQSLPRPRRSRYAPILPLPSTPTNLTYLPQATSHPPTPPHPSSPSPHQPLNPKSTLQAAAAQETWRKTTMPI